MGGCSVCSVWVRVGGRGMGCLRACSRWSARLHASLAGRQPGALDLLLLLPLQASTPTPSCGRPPNPLCLPASLCAAPPPVPPPSFYHQTFNNTSSERIVLIMRHWHPEVTPVERIAIQFLFDCLDARTAPGIADAQRRAADALAGSAAGRAAALVSGAGKGRKKAKGAAGGGAKKSGGGGFGAAAPAKGFGKK